MPKMRQLPAPLAMLSRRNAVEISDSRFHTDVDKLIEALERAASSDRRAGAASAASRAWAGRREVSRSPLARPSSLSSRQWA